MSVKEYVKMVLHEQGRMNKQPQIFCDMDGVLVDFLSTATRDINTFLDRTSKNPNLLNTKAARIYRKVLRDLGPDFRAESESDLQLKSIRNLSFFIIGRDPGEWFSKLEPLDDGVNVLWPYITSLGVQVSLLTAGVPSKSGMPAEQGKKMWAHEHLSPSASRLICVPAVEKQLFAVEDGISNILIDDKPRTIEQWNNAGGIGVLHVSGRSDLTIKNIRALEGRLNT